MIDISNLGLTLNKKRILNGITLQLNDGEIIGIAGNSGSGKTVFLKTIAGLIKGYKGNISIRGISPLSPLKKGNIKNITCLSKSLPVNREETLFEFLLLSRIPHKKIFSPFSDYDLQVTEEYINLFDLTGFRDEKINILSDSILQRALLAYTFIRESYALLLDNPTNDLDIGSIKLLKKTLSKYVINGDRIVIISSNDLNFISQISDRIIVMDKGSIAEEGTTEIISAEMIKKYFGIEVIISRNIYNGKPEIHFFPES